MDEGRVPVRFQDHGGEEQVVAVVVVVDDGA